MFLFVTLAALWLAVMLVVVVVCHMAARGDRALAEPRARATRRSREASRRAA